MLANRVDITVGLNRANDYTLEKPPMVGLNGSLPQILQCKTREFLESLKNEGFASQEEFERATAEIQHSGHTVIESSATAVDLETVISGLRKGST